MTNQKIKEILKGKIPPEIIEEVLNKDFPSLCKKYMIKYKEQKAREKETSEKVDELISYLIKKVDEDGSINVLKTIDKIKKIFSNNMPPSNQSPQTQNSEKDVGEFNPKNCNSENSVSHTEDKTADTPNQSHPEENSVVDRDLSRSPKEVNSVSSGSDTPKEFDKENVEALERYYYEECKKKTPKGDVCQCGHLKEKHGKHGCFYIVYTSPEGEITKCLCKKFKAKGDEK